MADKKISALSSSTTPLAGTEVLPIVQSGATVKVAVSDLTAGRAISATSVTASTGNFVVGTSGQGVDFSATPNTGTSELLADYEEGTFTPTYNGTTPGTTTYVLQNGTYTKIGRAVYYNIRLAWSNTTGTGSGVVGGFPYTAQNAFHTTSILPSDYTITALNIMSARIGFGASLDLFQTPVGGGTQSAAPVDTSAELTITGFYFV
jgi:hypothetical protein